MGSGGRAQPLAITGWGQASQRVERSEFPGASSQASVVMPRLTTHVPSLVGAPAVRSHLNCPV
jgi:hypothetical protein